MRGGKTVLGTICKPFLRGRHQEPLFLAGPAPGASLLFFLCTIPPEGTETVHLNRQSRLNWDKPTRERQRSPKSFRQTAEAVEDAEQPEKPPVAPGASVLGTRNGCFRVSKGWVYRVWLCAATARPSVPAICFEKSGATAGGGRSA